ncbi:MAG: TIGR04076 family protein [Asgard group archaeon]|nr:TIGR04076 family protein [Asgard group archaeon]
MTIKITVLKMLNPKEVFGKEIKNPEGKTVPTCSAFEEGQEFLIEKLNKPENFCGWAWRDIYKDLSVLDFGGDFSWSEPNQAITCCTDGMRPVIFKLERLVEQ